MVFFKEGLCFFLLLFVSKASSSYIHGCYLSNATDPQQQFQNLNIDTYTPSLCSHIFFSYPQIKDDFTLDLANPGHLKWGAENKFYNQLTELKSQQLGLKTILSLGGSYELQKMLIDDEKRQTFVQSATNFVKHFEFDGVNIDASQSINNKNSFIKLIEEFKTTLPGKLIIVSVPSNHFNFDVPAIAKYSNFVNILEGQSNAISSNLLDATNSDTFDTMYNWVSNGLPKNKLRVGMNFLKNNTFATATKVREGHHDANGNSSFASLNVKNKWMKENGFGGTFVRLLVESKIAVRDPCCYQYADQEIVDNNLSDMVSALPESCCENCANLGAGCKGWVWDSTNGGTCWFKTTSGPTITKVGAITGVFCDEFQRASKKDISMAPSEKTEL